MHEMAICESILGILKEQARAQDFGRVRRVRIEIGRLSAVDAEALKFGFDVVMRETLADGAALEIVETDARATCLDCGAAAKIAERFDPCPECGSHRLEITAGKELRIRELEVS